MTVKEVAKLKMSLVEFKRPRNSEEYKKFIQNAITGENITVKDIEDILDYYDNYLTEGEKPWKGILREEFTWWAVCQLMVDYERIIFDH